MTRLLRRPVAVGVRLYCEKVGVKVEEKKHEHRDDWGEVDKRTEEELKNLEARFKEQWDSIINEEIKAVEEDGVASLILHEARDTRVGSVMREEKEEKKQPQKLKRPHFLIYMTKLQKDVRQQQDVIARRQQQQWEKVELALSALESRIVPPPPTPEDPFSEKKELVHQMKQQAVKVDDEYRQELTELKIKYESQKEDMAKIFKNMVGKWKGDEFALQELYSHQSELLKNDYKRDLARLSRGHDMSVAEVREAADRSSHILQSVITRQGKRSVWAGITIGLLMLALSLSLMLNYFQYIFIKMNGTQFILSRVLKYLYHRQAAEKDNPEEKRHRKHMEILMGTS